MSQAPKTKEELRDARRDSLLRAAELVFAKKGFSFTKMSDIAKAAGVSHGLVYHYFDSKESLFAELIDEMMGQLATELAVEESSPRARLERVLSLSFRRTKGDPQSMQLMTQAMLIGGLPDPLRQRAFERAKHLVAQMDALVRQCQAAGEITDRVDPEQITALIASVMRGMSIRPPGGEEMAVAMPTVGTLMTLLRAPSPRGTDTDG